MSTSVSDILIYLSLALVVLWTIRLARSKGRNPFIWGGVALGLMLIPSWPALLSMAPMLVLLFLKSPQVAAQDVRQESVNCPKCQAAHAAGHTYCVNCGWELAKPYFEDRRKPPEEAPAPQGNASRSEPRSRPAEQPVEPRQPVFEPLPVVDQRAPVEEPAASPAASEGAEPEQSPQEPQEVPEAPKPFFRRPITPASFTERGLALLNQGKLLEAVDQFTKAIAIDPNYAPAWAQRAEAYTRLGRNNKAEEDRRHTEGLEGQATG